MPSTFQARQFILITLIVSLWVQASEVFRYFVFVMPIMRESLSDLSNVAPMNLSIFSIWGAWGFILTGFTVFMLWLYSKQFGHSLKNSILAGSLSWLFFFVLFWIGLANMGLAEWSILGITLPLSWLELVIASIIANALFTRGLTVSS